MPYGGAPVCTSVVWAIQFAAKYAALVVMKSLALSFADTVFDVSLTLAAAELKQRLEREGTFDRANANVKRAFDRAPPIARRRSPRRWCR